MPGEQAGFVVLTNTDVNEFYQALSFQLTEALAGLPYRNLSELFFQNYRKESEEQKKEIDSLKQIDASNHSPALSPRKQYLL